jgi:hypothetical protein
MTDQVISAFVIDYKLRVYTDGVIKLEQSVNHENVTEYFVRFFPESHSSPGKNLTIF